MTRISRDEYYMRIAEATSKRSTCDRAMVGAVAVIDNRIIATGYNGAPAGWRHCDEHKHQIKEGHCIRTVHAEMNIITQCAKFGISLKGATIYCTHSPCYQCLKHLENTGVREIKYLFYKQDPDMPKDVYFMNIITEQLEVK